MWIERWWETISVGSSQRPDEAGGSPTWGTPDRVASGPDEGGTRRYCQTVRVRRARSEGAARANQWWKLRNGEAGSNLADLGRSAAHERPGGMPSGCSTPKPISSLGEEAMVKVCGVVVAMLSE
jgi:hypothetical protein